MELLKLCLHQPGEVMISAHELMYRKSATGSKEALQQLQPKEIVECDPPSQIKSSAADTNAYTVQCGEEVLLTQKACNQSGTYQKPYLYYEKCVHNSK
ncbi:hypothetical protein UY3_15054 [Chelonia mydas]|uniref:Uncharacterized protein n=1 Tax=Chelonia mydas TaxID=8469 RepID=M7AT59_CHEMY|nr:hypothetical protein UY3_15054 [Chelonia mydas]